MKKFYILTWDLLPKPGMVLIFYLMPALHFISYYIKATVGYQNEQHYSCLGEK